MDLTRSLAELIEGFVVQRERRARLMPDLYDPPTYPNPAASEADLAAVEARIGRGLDPVYRQLLQVADGWTGFNGSRNLLGTADIGRSDTWWSAKQMIEIYVDEGERPRVGWPSDSADAFPIAEHFTQTAFIVMTDGADRVAGQVRDFSSGSNEVFHNVQTWLRCQLADETDYLDGESFGPHGRAWRQVVSADTPSIPQIVAKLTELRRAFRPIKPVWLPSAGPDPNPGAITDRIDAEETALGVTLCADHRLFGFTRESRRGFGVNPSAVGATGRSMPWTLNTCHADT
ncbi:SMI1/KNR4 family protein [Nocardia uniformis]|uniref:SMI1/KNR4 family protein n=1 Tax=Nocardia uniformis TaxID=53432 RepID=A0A849CFP9_9NOCA|nr:SMI1/KNR4 family protein [Nocardia uniformis]NNH75680.1 SMI1/KNR4 family protein [Nocardia uniformis]